VLCFLVNCSLFKISSVYFYIIYFSGSLQYFSVECCISTLDMPINHHTGIRSQVKMKRWTVAMVSPRRAISSICTSLMSTGTRRCLILCPGFKYGNRASYIYASSTRFINIGPNDAASGITGTVSQEEEGDTVKTTDKPLEYYVQRRFARERRNADNYADIREKKRKTRNQARRKFTEFFEQLTDEEKDSHKQKALERNLLSDKRLAQAKIDGIKVCIDCSFAERHREREKKSLVVQVCGVAPRL
jgi:hypothetical protein